MKWLLERKGETLPAPKTLWELLNEVSNKTRSQIYKAQFERAACEEIERFQQ